MRTFATIAGICLLAGVGCGGEQGSKSGAANEPTTAGDGMMQAGVGTDVAPANDDVSTDPAGMTLTDGSDTSGGQAGVGGAGDAMMSGVSSDAMSASQDPQAAGEDSPAADDCAERRVSYSVPCRNDPDPCGLDSGYLGDEYCLLPPPEGEGIQIHIGPRDYDDPAEIAKYVMQPGDEFNNSVLGHIPLDQDIYFARTTVQMRPGSHHWISSVVAGKPEERVYDGTSCGDTQQVGSIGGGQNLIYDNPPGGIPAPENEGLGRPLAADSSLCMNLHAYNFTETPQLREMWINVYFIDEADVTQRAQGIGVVGGLGMAIAPGASETLTYTETFDAPGRIIQLFGHRHAWTPRFAVWLNDDLIYDSWDWEESVVFNYDSLTQNPPLDTEGRIDGAASGVLEVNAGDELTFSCFIENGSDMTLRFRNELYTGEMCNLWGSAVGTGIWASRF